MYDVASSNLVALVPLSPEQVCRIPGTISLSANPAKKVEVGYSEGIRVRHSLCTADTS
jgi:hypothetical protein